MADTAAAPNSQMIGDYWLLVEGTGPDGHNEPVWPVATEPEQLKGFVRSALQETGPGSLPAIVLRHPALARLDYMEIQSAWPAALVTRTFLEALRNASADETAYPAEVLVRHRRAPPAPPFFVWIPRQVEGAIDRRRSEVIARPWGQQFSTIVLTDPHGSGLPQIFSVPGAYIFAQDRVRQAVERADVRGAAFAPLDSAHSPWDGIKREAVRRLVQERPDDAEGWFELGRISLALEKPPEAVQAFDRALALDPEFADALYLRGVAFKRAGDLPAALKSIERAIAGSRLKYVWTEYPQLLRESGRVQDALSAAKQLVERFAHSPIAWQELAATLREMGRLEEAERAEERAKQLRSTPRG